MLGGAEQRRLATTFAAAWGVRGVAAAVPLLLQLLQQPGRRPGAARLVRAAFGRKALRFGLCVAAYFGTFRFLEARLRTLLVRTGLPEARRRWLRALLAGLGAAWALLLEADPGVRRLLAQYAAVRAAQCLYEHYRGRVAVLARLGDRLYDVLFALASGQLVYSFVMRPDALDPSYARFLASVARMHPTLVGAIRSQLIDGCLEFDKVELVLHEHFRGLPPGATGHELGLRQVPAVIDCALVHPEEPSCLRRVLGMWPFIFRLTFPMYLSLHTLPPALFRLRACLARPGAVLAHGLRSALRSSSFMASFVFLSQAVLCGQRAALRRGWLAGDHPLFYYLVGLLPSVAVLLEKPSRRIELALFVAPPRSVRT